MDYKEAADRIRRHNRIHSKHERNAIFITKALDLAADVLEKSCWIPCSERLPKKDVSVLIYAAGHRVTAYFDAVKGVFRLTEDDNLYYLQQNVTHWMPLPEPPEEVQDDD